MAGEIRLTAAQTQGDEFPLDSGTYVMVTGIDGGAFPAGDIKLQYKIDGHDWADTGTAVKTDVPYTTFRASHGLTYRVTAANAGAVIWIGPVEVDEFSWRRIDFQK